MAAGFAPVSPTDSAEEPCVSTPTITFRASGGVGMRVVTGWPPRVAARAGPGGRTGL